VADRDPALAVIRSIARNGRVAPDLNQVTAQKP